MTVATDIGSATLAGNRYGDLNQDYAVVHRTSPPEAVATQPAGRDALYIGAVLDGHGLLGEVAARRAGDTLVADLSRSCLGSNQLGSLAKEQLQQLMTASFRKGHESVLALYDDPPASVVYPKSSTVSVTYNLHHSNGLHVYRSNGGHPISERLLECGATCSVAVVQGSHLCIANVGDSTAVLGSLQGDDLLGRVVTVQHCGFNPGEAARIQANHNTHTRIMPADGYLSITDGLWAGYELSVTRALGHKFLEPLGVSPEPAVAALRLGAGDCCLVMASDGVWDVMGPREAVNRVMDVVGSGGSAQQAAAQLVEDAVLLAEGAPGGDADNTSAVVLVFG